MLIFEKGTSSHHNEIERVLRAAFGPYVRGLGRELTPDAYDWLETAVARGDIYVAIDNAAIIGVVATSRQDGEIIINQLAVNPERQGNGIGSWLLGRMEDVALQTSVRELSLNTAEMREDLVGFYRWHGFVIVRRGPPAHGKDAHQRVYMKKSVR